MEPRVVAPDPRIDAIRGCAALERGPLVYCIETADLPAGFALEDIIIDPAARPVDDPRPDLLEGAVGLAIDGRRRSPADDGWPYVPATTDAPPAIDPPSGRDAARQSLRAIPYLAWANRGAGAMRVWIPRDDGSV
jgi:DUF1680 family protein